MLCIWISKCSLFHTLCTAVSSIERFEEILASEPAGRKANAKPHIQCVWGSESAVICIARNIFNKAAKMYFALIFDVKHTFQLRLVPPPPKYAKQPKLKRNSVHIHLDFLNRYTTQLPSPSYTCTHKFLHSFDVNFRGHTFWSPLCWWFLCENYSYKHIVVRKECFRFCLLLWLLCNFCVCFLDVSQFLLYIFFLLRSKVEYFVKQFKKIQLAY